MVPLKKAMADAEEPNKGVKPDEAVAYGAAVQGSRLVSSAGTSTTTREV
jgi:molecular chaperone DnaK (HSP70)